MKKTFALFLALLMLVSCGCSAPMSEDIVDVIGNRDDLLPL